MTGGVIIQRIEQRLTARDSMALVTMRSKSGFGSKFGLCVDGSLEETGGAGYGSVHSIANSLGDIAKKHDLIRIITNP